MSTRRGKKINQVKNYVAAKDFAAGKRIGRPKQRWIQDVVEVTLTDANGDVAIVTPGSGHWEKVTSDGTK